MKKNNVINVKDICISTYTNVDGQALKIAVTELFSVCDIVVVSFHGIDSVSTSFLNSSFGELVSNFGIDNIRKRVKVTNYTTSLINSIKKYINSLTFELV